MTVVSVSYGPTLHRIFNILHLFVSLPYSDADLGPYKTLCLSNSLPHYSNNRNHDIFTSSVHLAMFSPYDRYHTSLQPIVLIYRAHVLNLLSSSIVLMSSTYCPHLSCSCPQPLVLIYRAHVLNLLSSSIVLMSSTYCPHLSCSCPQPLVLIYRAHVHNLLSSSIVLMSSTYCPHLSCSCPQSVVLIYRAHVLNLLSSSIVLMSSTY
jgi:hypothetical protein